MSGCSLAWLASPRHYQCSRQVTLSKPFHHSPPPSFYMHSEHIIATLQSRYKGSMR